MGDLLNASFINSLEQLWVTPYGLGDKIEFPVYDIDVETGLLRIDVMGQLDVYHISDIKKIRSSMNNKYYEIEDLYLNP